MSLSTKKIPITQAQIDPETRQSDNKQTIRGSPKKSAKKTGVGGTARDSGSM